MRTALGLEIGPSSTAWAIVTVGDSFPPAVGISGEVPSSAVLTPAGQLLGGNEAAAWTGDGVVVRDFMARLGESAPILVGSTPYGAEALLAAVVTSAREATRAASLVAPDVIALAHPLALDQYRLGLLVEAVRLSGVVLTQILLVPEDLARAACASARASGAQVENALDVAMGSALVATNASDDARLPDGVRWASMAFLAGGAALGGAATGLGVATTTMAESVRAAAYAGTPLSPPTLPTLPTPLSTGYAGAQMSGPAAGYAGAPLATPAAGYAGDPLAASGASAGTAAGTSAGVVAIAGVTAIAVPMVGVAAGETGTSLIQRILPKRFPAIMGLVAVGAIAAGSAVALVDNRDDAVAVQAHPIAVASSQAAAAATTIMLEVTTSPPAATETPTTTNTTTTTTTASTTTNSTTTAEAAPIAPPFDPLGTWVVVGTCAAPCESGTAQVTIADYDPVTGTFVITFPGEAPSTATIVGTAITFDIVSGSFRLHFDLTVSSDGQVWSGTSTHPGFCCDGTVVFTRIVGS